MNEKKKLSLPVLIVIALVLGVIAGLLMMSHVEFAVTFIKPFLFLSYRLLYSKILRKAINFFMQIKKATHGLSFII